MDTNTINRIISEYLAAKAAEAAANKAAREAKKRAELAADRIIRHAAGKASFDTDAYTVSIEKVTRIILDTEKLYADFKDIKSLDQYGKESSRDVITALAREQPAARTA